MDRAWRQIHTGAGHNRELLAYCIRAAFRMAQLRLWRFVGPWLRSAVYQALDWYREAWEH